MTASENSKIIQNSFLYKIDFCELGGILDISTVEGLFVMECDRFSRTLR